MELIEFFEQSIADFRLSRSEKAAITEVLKEKPLSEKSKWVLRSKIFSLAKSKVDSRNFLEIIDWLNRATKLLEKTNNGISVPEVAVSAFFSPGLDCLNKINQLISQAEKNLEICVFTITDDRIVDEIMEAHRRGVSVRIISDNHKSEDRGSDIKKLANRGLNIRLDSKPDHMHHKFMLVDGKTLMTGSYNWTRSAANGNEENILVTDDTGAIKKFQAEFESLWDQYSAW